MPHTGIHLNVCNTIVLAALSAPAQLARQPGFGYSPVTMNGCFRDTEQLRRLGHLQAAEETALYHERLARIQAGQFAESGVEGDDLILRGHRPMERLIKGNQ